MNGSPICWTVRTLSILAALKVLQCLAHNFAHGIIDPSLVQNPGKASSQVILIELAYALTAMGQCGCDAEVVECSGNFAWQWAERMNIVSFGKFLDQDQQFDRGLRTEKQISVAGRVLWG